MSCQGRRAHQETLLEWKNGNTQANQGNSKKGTQAKKIEAARKTNCHKKDSNCQKQEKQGSFQNRKVQKKQSDTKKATFGSTRAQFRFWTEGNKQGNIT